jgi:hypothetical protein
LQKTPNPIEHFFLDLGQAVPEFETVYRTHLGEYEELLPYVLINDFSRMILSEAERRDTSEKREARVAELIERSFAFLERQVESAPESVRELIVEFCWSLAARRNEKNLFEFLQMRLGPQTQVMVDQFFQERT